MTYRTEDRSSERRGTKIVQTRRVKHETEFIGPSPEPGLGVDGAEIDADHSTKLGTAADPHACRPLDSGSRC